MSTRNKQAVQYFILRMIVAWLVVCVLPALVMWLPYLAKGYMLTAQKYSILLVSVGILLANVLLDRLTHFPGQRSVVHILPTLLVVSLLIALVLLVFRLPYSVYYLAVVFSIGTLFLFVSQIIRQYWNKKVIAYIPVGRCQNLPMAADISWLALALTLTESPTLITSAYLTVADKKLITRYDENLNVDAIVADLSSTELDKNWQRFLAQQTLRGVPVYNHLQVHESLTGRSPIQHLYENDLGALQPSQGYSLIKRWCDVMIVILSVPFLLPLLLCVGITIRLESSGNAIFIQNRVGQGGKIFKMYKFRSMRADAPAQNQLMTQANDSRITRVGKLIRKLRIDELPQFYNVLRGEMSLIGPRPELPNNVEELDKKIPFYLYRQIVKPGISGWAQVMQGDGHVENIQAKLEYDFYYIKNFSFTLDFLIVIKTIQTMLTGFGAR